MKKFIDIATYEQNQKIKNELTESNTVATRIKKTKNDQRGSSTLEYLKVCCACSKLFIAKRYDAAACSVRCSNVIKRRKEKGLAANFDVKAKAKSIDKEVVEKMGF